jgi:hypothetical protein
MMRLIVGTAVCAAAVLTAMAAAWAGDPQPTGEETLARIIAHPRYYAIATSGGMGAQNGSKMCMGGESFRKLIAGFKDAAKDPKALAEFSKGCTHKIDRTAAGSFSTEMACDKAAGATSNYRMTISGSLDKFRQHMEMTLPGFGAAEADKVVTTDTTMTYLGECPANVTPGQIIDRDGKVFDATAMLQALVEARRGSPPK